MRNRKYICVQGPEGTGKTTLIQRLMNSTRRALWLVCRTRPAPSPELAGKWIYGTKESREIAEAGAVESCVYYLPGESQGIHDLFWDSEFIQSYSDAIAFEGCDPPGVESDLYVHVMRPLMDEEELTSLEEVEVCQIDSRDYLRMAGISLPEDARVLSEEENEQQLEEENEDLAGSDEDISEEIIEIPDELAELILRALERKPMPIKKKVWKPRPGHEEIARCGLVIINIHDEPERPAAERTRRQIEALRTRPELRADILGHRYDRLRVTIVIANLCDPRDPELRKALARIKRVVTRRY